MIACVLPWRRYNKIRAIRVPVWLCVPVLYWGRDEKIGKKDRQDDLGSEVARKALWKKIGLGRHQKAG